LLRGVLGIRRHFHSHVNLATAFDVTRVEAQPIIAAAARPPRLPISVFACSRFRARVDVRARPDSAQPEIEQRHAPHPSQSTDSSSTGLQRARGRGSACIELRLQRSSSVPRGAFAHAIDVSQSRVAAFFCSNARAMLVVPALAYPAPPLVASICSVQDATAVLQLRPLASPRRLDPWPAQARPESLKAAA